MTEPQPTEWTLAGTDNAGEWTPGSTDHLIHSAASLLRAVALTGRATDMPGWMPAYQEWLTQLTVWTGRHPEDTCHKCGQPFINWSAPSPLWNEVMRGGDINNSPEPYSGIVCPSCFMQLAEDAGVGTGWRLYAATVFRILQTVTPSGRVWNPETWMFDDPGPPMPVLAELPVQEPR